METALIIILVSQAIFILAILFILQGLKSFLKEVLLILKSQNVYEAKEVTEENEEETEEERTIPLEEMEPEKAAEILKKELGIK